MGGSQFQALMDKASMRFHLKNKLKTKGLGMVAQVVEYLLKALSSSTAP
jgi:hypothetical protein